MTITDINLAKQLHAVDVDNAIQQGTWGDLLTHEAASYVSQAKRAKRLLLPPSPEQLRIERGEAAYHEVALQRNYYRKWDDLNAKEQEQYCAVVDAVLAKKAGQDREASDG